jgi:hypothetical protein
MFQQYHFSTLTKKIFHFLIFHRVVFLFAVTAMLISCKEELPVLTGNNEMFTTNGNADDGDDQATPPAGGASYINPAIIATDGPATAVSNPKSFRTLGGSGLAQPGVQSTRPSAIRSRNSVSSTFVVNKAVTLKYKIESSAAVTLEKGIASYIVRAIIMDNKGQPVTGSRFTTNFDFKENTNGQNDVDQNGVQFTQVVDGNPIQSTDTGPVPAFTLQPGSYTLMFYLDIDALADRQIPIEITGIRKAEIKAIASLDLIVP